MEWYQLSDSAIRMLYALKELSTVDATPVTLESVCDTYGIPRVQALSVIKELEQAGMVKKGKGTLRAVGTEKPVKFVKSSPSRLDELEQTVVQLKRILKARVLGESSGIAPKLYGDERQLVEDIERAFGRGLSPDEAFLLGRCVQGWGVARVRKLFYDKVGADNPLLIVYAMLSKGASGQAYNQRDTEPKVVYRERG
jgi:hypothetical protein